MVKRLNIAVPDELHEKLQGVKDEINVSRVCQEAIMKEIETVEINKNGDERDFILSSKREYEKECEDVGAKLASSYIKSKMIKYPDLVRMSKMLKDCGNGDEGNALLTVLETAESYDLVESLKEEIADFLKDDSAFDVDCFAIGFMTRISSYLDSLE